LPFDSDNSFHNALPASILRLLAITASLVILVIAGSLPILTGKLSFFRPDFVLMAIFLWSVLRPRLCPVPLTFLAGILHDAIAGNPMGMSALCLVLIQTIVERQHKFFSGQPFVVIWVCFLLAALMNAAMQWGIFFAFSGSLAPLLPVLTNIASSIAIFPLLAPILAAVVKVLARR
jgi:rod shape-determining protein MreD